MNKPRPGQETFSVKQNFNLYVKTSITMKTKVYKKILFKKNKNNRKYLKS
jgi:predicted methyltransferase